jgi:hypothetical protein
LALLRGEVVDHQTLGWRQRAHAAKELLDRKLEMLAARRAYMLDRHDANLLVDTRPVILHFRAHYVPFSIGNRGHPPVFAVNGSAI